MKPSIFLWLIGIMGLPAPGIAAESWPPSVSAPDFLPHCARLMHERSVLFEGGGVLVRDGDAWLALGVGTAPLTLEGGRKQSEDAAYKVANAKALAALTEVFWGARVSGHDSMEAQSEEDMFGLRAIERIRSMTETERGGVLAGSWEAGRWRLHDSAEVGILRIVASPEHPIAQAAARITVLSDTLDPAWRDAVLSKPSLRHGGVAAIVQENEIWLLIAGTVQINKDAVSVPLSSIQVAEAKARTEWLRFFQGVCIQDRTKAQVKIDRIQTEGDPAWESIHETLSSHTEAQARGMSRGMIPVGMWLSDAGDSYRLAAVFRLSFSREMPGDASGSLRPPVIP